MSRRLCSELIHTIHIDPILLQNINFILIFFKQKGKKNPYKYASIK